MYLRAEASEQLEDTRSSHHCTLRFLFVLSRLRLLAPISNNTQGPKGTPSSIKVVAVSKGSLTVENVRADWLSQGHLVCL